MWFVHPNAVQLSGIFFSNSTDTKLAYKLVETLFTRCSLLSACFSFGLFLFCLPDTCAFAIFQENQNKCKRSIGLCHFIFLSICLSVRHAPYLRNRTSSNQNFLIVHTCKMKYLQAFFFFIFLKFWFFGLLVLVG